MHDGSGGVTDGWAESALQAVLGRVAVTLAEVGPRFPLSADPDTGTWTTTRRGSWTGGFWAGLLWLRARSTGAPADRAAAEECTARLADWADADTATRGLILWYGTALATASEPAAALRTRAARACLAAFDPELGLVPWGAAFGGPRLLARADGAPGLVPLLASAGPRGREAAASHLRRHLELCVGDGGPLAPAWRHDPATGWHPLPEPAPGWSRGRAWLLLAAADALTRPGGATGCPDHLHATAGSLGAPVPAPAEIEDEAEAEAGAAPLAETARPAARADGAHPAAPTHTPPPAAPLIPPADTSHPDGPPDTSAAAITAVALLKLATLPGQEACARRAEAVLHRLVTAHLSGTESATATDSATGTDSATVPDPATGTDSATAPDPAAGTDPPPGMLLHGCHDAATGTAVQHELIWGDFFLALGLAALTGLVDPREA
ncbi:sugar ABC transporter permease [Streptomyces flavofungini]|nr:sugar ABC transporter permease [Streptomyces flavofungini]WJV51189.1 sugar ABC transporter permease [Streptomyces flavofungini]